MQAPRASDFRLRKKDPWGFLIGLMIDDNKENAGYRRAESVRAGESEPEIQNRGFRIGESVNPQPPSVAYSHTIPCIFRHSSMAWTICSVWVREMKWLPSWKSMTPQPLRIRVQDVLHSAEDDHRKVEAPQPVVISFL